jgi:hypothetical protein
VSKEDRVIELLEELQELMPQFTKVVLESYADPEFILICNDDFCETFIEAFQLGVKELEDSDKNGNKLQ